jgi:hypothetical protein
MLVPSTEEKESNRALFIRGEDSMTAEIAILNKLAVALATDSAVTISAGDSEEKIYDSADKLFELSQLNPIGIMIYNGMQFMQAPLPMLIAEYRGQCRSFETVREAAEDFLRYLADWGNTSPASVFVDALESIIAPLIKNIRSRINKKYEEAFASMNEFDAERFKAIPAEQIAIFERFLSGVIDGQFVGGLPPEFDEGRIAIVRDIVASLWPELEDDLIEQVVNIARLALTKRIVSPSHTGIIVAGFGSREKFPSLISFTIDGIVFDKLKIEETNFVDIDRDGDRAKVLPFAQKEMVERFLYGLDTQIEKEITKWCEETIPEIRTQIVDNLDMDDEAKAALTKHGEKAERAFLDDLRDKRFKEIRSSSQAAIEGMVEFMPKPELAKMAEALVNLTSIKRRVSRGLETVGGPIDVAVISRSEGFIWVKRKHYFSMELNPRYSQRIAGNTKPQRGSSDGYESEAPDREHPPVSQGSGSKQRRGRQAKA